MRDSAWFRPNGAGERTLGVRGPLQRHFRQYLTCYTVAKMDPAPLASQLYISIISNSGPPQAQALSGWQWGLSPHGLLCNPLTTSTPLKTHSIVLNSTEHYLVPMCCMLSRFKRCSPSASSIPGISSERSSILARPAVTPGLKYTPLGPNLSGPCRYLIHLEDSPGESPAPGA